MLCHVLLCVLIKTDRFLISSKQADMIHRPLDVDMPAVSFVFLYFVFVLFPMPVSIGSRTFKNDMGVHVQPNDHADPMFSLYSFFPH